jgi:hypothetical protein
VTNEKQTNHETININLVHQLIECPSNYNQTNATKKLGQNKKLISPKNPSHGPSDAVGNHMGTYLVELNEAIH